jgi:pentatricopeptide repeat protein
MASAALAGDLRRRGAAALLRHALPTAPPIFAPAYDIFRLGSASPLSTAAAAAPQSLPQLRQLMEEALRAGRFSEVPQLLRASDCRVVVPAAAESPVAVAQLYDCALKACAAAGDGQGALRLVGAMWRRGVPVGRVAQGSALKALCAAGQRQEAMAHLKSIPGGRLTPVLFNTVLSACASAGDADTGAQCWAYMRRRGVPPDAVTWCELMRLHGAAGDAAAVDAAWAQAAASPALAKGAEAEGRRCMAAAARVGALAAAGETAAARGALDDFMQSLAHLLPVQLRLPADGGGAALAGAAPVSAAGRWRAAAPLEHLLSACNSALRAAEARGEWGAMRRVVGLMTSRGLPPDAATYNALLRAALRRGDGPRAVQEGVAEMAALGIAPDAHTHCLLVEAHAAAGDASAARAALAAAAAAGGGAAPPAAAWLALFRAHAGGGDLEGLLAAYEDAAAAGVEPSAPVFAACLEGVRAWAAAGHASAGEEGQQAQHAQHAGHGRRLAEALVRRWGADMARAGADRAPAAAAALLAAHGAVGQVGEAMALMRRRYPLGGGGKEEEADVEELVLRALAAARGSRAASPGAGAAGGPPPAAGPDARVFGAAIAACGRAGALREVAELLRGMAVSPRSASPSLLPRCILHDSSRVAHRPPLPACLPLFFPRSAPRRATPARPLTRRRRCPQALGLAPDAHVFTSLIAACAPARRPRLARRLLGRMAAAGVAPTAWTFNALLKVECFQGSLGADAVEGVVEEMRAAGVQPDAVTWGTALAAAQAQGAAEAGDRARRELQLLRGPARGEGGGAEGEAAGGAGGGRHWRGYYALDEEDEW